MLEFPTVTIHLIIVVMETLKETSKKYIEKWPLGIMVTMHLNTVAMGVLRAYKILFLAFHSYNNFSLLFSTHFLLILLAYFCCCCCVKFVAKPWNPKEVESLKLPHHLYLILKILISSQTIFSFHKPVLKNISRLKISRWWKREHLMLKTWKAMKNLSSCWRR